MLNIKHILHPTDFSEHSNSAFHVACALARDYGAQVIVLHVMPSTEALPVPMPVALLSLPPEGIREATEAELRQVASADTGVRIQHRLEEGVPAPVILNIAAELQADLIVMGTHGRTGLARLLMGSVAEHVMRDASCPVLTIKPPFGQSNESADTLISEVTNDEPVLP